MDEKKVREEDYLEFPWGIEDTIENLRELKSILQKRVREEDCDGKGTQDAFELGFDFDRAIEALEKQLPKKVEVEEWCPSCCPSCGYELSEDLGDGYYKHPDFIERCPNPECAQRLEWSKLK